MIDDKLSEIIGRYAAGEYWVTAVIWRTRVEHNLFDTFEIGIRRKEHGKFWLLQSDKWNHQTVQEVANVIATMLADKTQCYTPEFFQENMTP